MKKSDWIVVFASILFFLPFLIIKDIYSFYSSFNTEHGMITSFIKFAILATFGEAIGLRIRTGNYYQNGFGLFPRALVWGFLGLTIKLAFVIFAVGTPAFLSYLGFKEATTAMQSSFSIIKILVAFSISTTMNLIYAPIMMTFHKITDTHILNSGGTLAGFFKPIKFGEIINNLNWNIQWNFVFKKTIPFFWIPAHTITFLLPPEFQVLFAAILGIILGVLLAVASQMGSKQ